MKRILLLFFLSAFATVASASWSDQFRYTVYGTAEGLCDEYVLSTFKDRTGYLWICTSNGLDRFDGIRFVHFNSHSPDPATRIDNDFVYEAVEDGHQGIWVVSNTGVTRISKADGSITFPKDIWPESDLLAQPMIGILAADDNRLWILQRDALLAVRLDRDGQVCAVERTASQRGGLRYMVQDGETVWTGGFNGIECYKSSDGGRLEAISLDPHPSLSGIRNVSTLFAYGIYLWIGTENGLFCYDTRNRVLETFIHDDRDPDSLADDHVTCLAADRSGDILVGTSKGIDNYSRGGRFRHISQGRPGRSINTNYVNHILLDEDGTMWVSTLVGGINQVAPKTIAFEDLLSVTEGSANIISCSFEDRDGNLLMGILGKGVGIRLAGQKEVRVYSPKENGGLTQDDVFVIRQDYHGDYWMASRNDGLILLRHADLTRPRFQSFTTANSGIGSNFIYDLEYDPVRKGLWYCTNENLEFLDIDKKEFLRIWLSFETEYPPRFNCLYIDHRNRLWAGGYGLCSIDLSRTVNLKGTLEADFLPSLEDPLGSGYERITSIVETSERTLFVGSQNNGVYQQGSDGDFRPIAVSHNPFRSRVTKLLADSSGDLWIGTTEGVFHYSPHTHLLSRFSTEDGLPSNHCYIDSGCGLSDGRVTFGTTNGLVLFDTPYKQRVGPQKKAVITGIVNSQHLLQLGRNDRLDVYPDGPSFEIRFSALDYNGPQRTAYSYRVDGLNPDWIVSSAGSVRYNFLNPGKYTFRVRCTNADNSWSDQETTLSIIVHPKFIQTVWFRLLLLLLISAIGAYILYLNFRSQQIKRRELAKQVDEKTADLKKAMQDVLESKESIEKQNLLLEEQKAKLEEYSARMDQANREKMALYTQLTHEFKTPLTLILGPLSELESRLRGKETESSLQIIERNAKYLLSLVNQILDLRRVDSRIQTHQESFDIARLSDIYALDYGSVLKERNISFETRLRIEQTHILSDRDIINKILSNLISNAVKHTPDGGKIVLGMAQFRRSSDNRFMQYLSVTNTGSYIPPSEQGKIFDLFYKIDEAPGHPAIGQSSSGIGLYLVRQLITTLGGEVRVRSKTGWGTSFRVFFPVEPVMGTASDDSVVETPPGEDSRPTLLLVEDNDDMRTYIRGLLSDKYRIAEAANGEKGFDLAKQLIPDFIISDLMMPVCDGLQLCRMVRADNALSHIPFLMLTALSNDDARLNSYKEGVDAFLVKPFEKEMLLTRIENILSNRRQQQDEVSFDLKNAYASVNIERPDKVFMENLLGILKDNYTDPEFNVPQLQSRMCMSMTPFYKKISALTGLTPALFIRLYRLQTAKKMLEDHAGDKGISVSEIAYMVGFNDPKYFSKCFQNQYHVLPSAILQGEA